MLRDPFDLTRQLGMAQRTGDAKSMDDAEGPSVAGMGEHFPFARDTGVAWDKDRTFNATHGIAVIDVPAWLDRRELAASA
jgi:hypothetical protein